MNIYKVGMGSTVANIKAPSAFAAAMYFGVIVIEANNPFAVVVYEENGEEFSSGMWWFSLQPDEWHVQMVMENLNPEDYLCEVIQGDVQS